MVSPLHLITMIITVLALSVGPPLLATSGEVIPSTPALRAPRCCEDIADCTRSVRSENTSARVKAGTKNMVIFPDSSPDVVLRVGLSDPVQNETEDDVPIDRWLKWVLEALRQDGLSETPLYRLIKESLTGMQHTMRIPPRTSQEARDTTLAAATGRQVFGVQTPLRRCHIPFRTPGSDRNLVLELEEQLRLGPSMDELLGRPPGSVSDLQLFHFAFGLAHDQHHRALAGGIVADAHAGNVLVGHNGSGFVFVDFGTSRSSRARTGGSELRWKSNFLHVAQRVRTHCAVQGRAARLLCGWPVTAWVYERLRRPATCSACSAFGIALPAAMDSDACNGHSEASAFFACVEGKVTALARTSMDSYLEAGRSLVAHPIVLQELDQLSMEAAVHKAKIHGLKSDIEGLKTQLSGLVDLITELRNAKDL